MPLTQSQLFHHVHAIVRTKNVAYFGGYQKAFGHYLKICIAQKLGYGFQVVELAAGGVHDCQKIATKAKTSTGLEKSRCAKTSISAFGTSGMLRAQENTMVPSKPSVKLLSDFEN